MVRSATQWRVSNIASRVYPTCALYTSISGKPEIGGPPYPSRRRSAPPQDEADYPSAGAPCDQWPDSILAAAMTACVRLSTPSFCSMAETCAFTVASETSS